MTSVRIGICTFQRYHYEDQNHVIDNIADMYLNSVANIKIRKYY